MGVRASRTQVSLVDRPRLMVPGLVLVVGLLSCACNDEPPKRPEVCLVLILQR